MYTSNIAMEMTEMYPKKQNENCVPDKEEVLDVGC